MKYGGLLTLLVFSLSAQAGTELKFTKETIVTKNIGIDRIDLNSENTEWIVQFKNSITEADKKALKGQGLKIHSYIPEDALIVRGSVAGVHQIKSLSSVQAVLEFKPSLKVSTSFDVLSAATSLKAETVIISLFEASERNAISQQIANIDRNIIVQRGGGHTLIVTTPRGKILDIAGLSGVEHIQPFTEVTPLHLSLEAEQPVSPSAGDYSDLTGFETGTKIMNLESAWSLGLTGNGQIVGMADTGLDSGNKDAIHTDFTGAVRSGYAVGLFGRDWSDPMGHGTHVAGSILGRGTASGGRLKGAAPSAQIVAQGMWSPMLNNLSVPNDLAGMFKQAYTDGARLHTNSWGAAANFGAYEKMAATVDQVMFEKQDLLILFAAGNSGVDKNRDGRIDPNSVGTPGTAKNALTVGASENLEAKGGIQKKIGELGSAKDNWPVAPISESKVSDNPQGVAMFSSRGPTQDGRLKPEILAPGTNILSVRSQQAGSSAMWGEYNKDYVWAGGTSMATPLTAGAAAVAREYLIEKLNHAKPTAALLKAYLLHTATEMYPGQYGEGGASQGQEILTKRPNLDEGYGLVNMARVIDMPKSEGFSLIDNKEGVATGAVVTTKFKVPSSGQLMVTLVWTDAPGSPNAAKSLVNDLDLEVTLPDGKVLKANDQINNNAFVQSAVGAGDVTVMVRGTNVPMGLSGKQPFALVISAQ